MFANVVVVVVVDDDDYDDNGDDDVFALDFVVWFACMQASHFCGASSRVV